MIEVVPSVAGGVILIALIVILLLWVRRRRIIEVYPPLVPPRDNRDREDVSHNVFPSTSEESELTSGRGSSHLTRGSSCSDITVPKKDNLKSKIKPYAEGLV